MNYISILVLVSVLISCVKAISSEELKEKYARLLIECAENREITPEDISMLKNKQMPDSYSVKCMFACAYKKTKMMDEAGNLWVEGVHAISKALFHDDPEKMEKAIEFTEACQYVNDIPVMDSWKGCERAAHIFECSVEKAPQFDFVV